MHAMSASHSVALSDDPDIDSAVMADLAPWVGADEPMLPARQVVWTSLALMVAILAVLLAA